MSRPGLLRGLVPGLTPRPRGANENGLFSPRLTNSEFENRRDARLRTCLTPSASSIHRRLQTRAGGGADAAGTAGHTAAHTPTGPVRAGRPCPRWAWVPRELGPRHVVTRTGLEPATAPPSSTGTPTLTLCVSTCAARQTARVRVSHTGRPHQRGEGLFSWARLPRRWLLPPPHPLRPKVPLPHQSRAEARARPPHSGQRANLPPLPHHKPPLQATGHLPGPHTTKGEPARPPKSCCTRGSRAVNAHCPRLPEPHAGGAC